MQQCMWQGLMREGSQFSPALAIIVILLFLMLAYQRLFILRSCNDTLRNRKNFPGRGRDPMTPEEIHALIALHASAWKAQRWEVPGDTTYIAAPMDDLINWTRRGLPALLEDLAEANATIAAVRALHKPSTYYIGNCRVCDGREYPCPTIRALDGDVTP